jgi:hypothetical protein
MAKESIFKIQKRPIFAENFLDESSVRINGGTPANLVFDNGVAVFGSSSNLSYIKPYKGTYSIRLRYKAYTLGSFTYIIDFRTIAGAGIGYCFQSSSALSYSSGTPYVNGVATNTVSTSTVEIVLSGITLDSTLTNINARYDGAARSLNSLELIEIYEGTLTAQDVANLYTNSRYRSLNYATGINEILNIDAKNGTITNKYSDNMVGTELITNGDFSSATGWTIGGESTISGGVGRLYSSAGAASSLSQIILTVGKRYRISLNILSASGTWEINLGTTQIVPGNTTGLRVFDGVCAGNTTFLLKRSAICDVTVDNVSVTEIVPELTNTSVTSVKQYAYNAIDFNGITSKLDAGNYNSLIGNKTVIFWAKLRSAGDGGFGRILDNSSFVMYTETNRTLSFSRNALSSNISSASSAFNYYKNFMVVVTSTSAGVGNIYINGVLSGTANQAGGTPLAGTTNLLVGNNAAVTRGLNGQLSGIRIIDGILTVNEIAELFNSERRFYNI